MPFVSTILKKKIVEQCDAIERLEKECESCQLFAKRKPELTFIYSVYNPVSPTKDSMVAISKYGKIYAMRTPDDLPEKELDVFAFVLRSMDDDEEIVVFSKRDYDAVKKYLYGNEKKVTLYS